MKIEWWKVGRMEASRMHVAEDWAVGGISKSTWQMKIEWEANVLQLLVTLFQMMRLV
jgi:hypothetical protein